MAKLKGTTKKGRDHLSDKMMAFVAVYSENNSREAARAAGYSPNHGRWLMKQPKIQEAIRLKQTTAIATCGMTLGKELAMSVKDVLHGLAQLAKYDLRKCVTESGAAIPIKEWEDTEAMALSSFKVIELFEGRGEDRQKTGELKEFKMADRGQNLERIGKHLGMFIDRRLELPADFDLRSIEDQEYFCKHGYWPDVDPDQPSTSGPQGKRSA